MAALGDKEKSELSAYAVRVRRELHSMPELSSREFRTGEYIAERLTELGVAFRRAHTGLIADVAGGDGKTVALRADFDGLPIKERTGLPFASTNGCMHACGHDGHTAMLLAAAKYLSSHKPAHNVRLIFQFGEEGDGGAETMIQRGALDGVDVIYAFHLCPDLDFGRVGTSPDTLFAGVAEFDVEFSGRSSHCAAKEEGVDALAAAVEFASVIDGAREEHKNTLLHVGKLTAGSARNVVAGSAALECTFRFFDKADREPVLDNLRGLVRETDAKFGTRGKLTVKSVYPPLVCDARCVRVLSSLTDVVTMPGRYTSEDFAFYLERVPGCMAWLGVRDETHTSPLHSDTFDFDERVLAAGAELFIKLADTGVF